MVRLRFVVLTGDLDREPPLCRGYYCRLDGFIGLLFATFYCNIVDCLFKGLIKLSLPRTDCPKAISAHETLSRIVPSSSGVKLLFEGVLPSESEPAS